jgi:hypothetical protein
MLGREGTIRVERVDYVSIDRMWVGGGGVSNGGHLAKFFKTADPSRIF